MGKIRSSYSVLFILRKNKLLKNGKAPIYLRLTINGESKEMSLKTSVFIDDWDIKKGIVKKNKKDAVDINRYIEGVRGQLFNVRRQLEEKGKHVSSSLVIDTYLGKTEKKWTLVELFELHNHEMKDLIGKDYSPATLQRYKTSLMHIRNFIKQDYKDKKLLISEIDLKFIKSFEYYLKVEVKCQHNSAMKHLKSLKKIVNSALSNEYITKNPFSRYKITQKSVDRDYLTENEIKQLINTQFTSQRLEVVRDLFLIQCFTGLSYVDLKVLSKDNIHIDINKIKWVVFKRVKTGIESRVPLIPKALDIIEKYKDNDRDVLFTVPSNQKMNKYLKEVALIANIKKPLHTHIGRHTFATTVTLSLGVSIEAVSAMIGHKKIQTTQIYAKVMDEKIINETNNVRNFKWGG